MSHELRKRLFAQLDSLVIVDPHTHINAHEPASHTLADILGYHYYTELAHSAGMPKNRIEEPDLDPLEKVARLVEKLAPLENTIQYSWLVEMCQKFFGLQDDRLTPANFENVYDSAAAKMSGVDWAEHVLSASKLSAVFLTNDFDDPLEGFDTNKYIPCLRSDDLVFHLAKPDVRERLERASGVALSNAESMRQAIGGLFDHFTARGARACAISLPPEFTPTKVSDGRVNSALDAVATVGTNCGEAHKRAIANFVFWTLAEYCADYSLPFDLMIGVNRGVYERGVHQGRDLYDSRVSLVQYKELFNAFPLVTFPVSVLASVTNQELASYAWIFPNVVTNGHWWYSNTPAYIEHDLAARLEAVPCTKQIGYYSDMYKLEFALPKFAMYKRILAKVLAERFVIDRGWSEERAYELGRQVLGGNTDRIFPAAEDRPAPVARQSVAADAPPVSPYSYSEPLPVMAAAAATVPFALGASDSSELTPYENNVITPASDADDADVDAEDADFDNELDLSPPMALDASTIGSGDLDGPEFDSAANVGDDFAEEADFISSRDPRETIPFAFAPAAATPFSAMNAEQELPPELEVVESFDDSANEITAEDSLDEIRLEDPEEVAPEIAEASQEPKQDLAGWNFLLDADKK